MASSKSLSYQTGLLVLLVTVLVAQQSHTAEAQVCSSQLNNLNVCAPFVVPGAADPQPSPECCTALRSVDHDCVCNTLRIASRLPSLCNIPAIACSSFF
ncbi:hypothetical protein TIFTF001_013845 [Ficus carica]|uniref:Bifunctional inhibitor/plant lipid transfer protein/seed storage helical domain-containing protein n=1 Tax=Ficus carica TaxID=3494 RepID=A0AA88D3E4_FICCA|nr:hypothetical protein TIFTF001_013845 [Ficus carica]